MLKLYLEPQNQTYGIHGPKHFQKCPKGPTFTCFEGPGEISTEGWGFGIWADGGVGLRLGSAWGCWGLDEEASI